MPVRRVLSNPNQQQSPNDPGIFTRLGSAIGRGIEAPGEAINSLAQLVGEPALLQGKPITQRITEGLGYNQQQLQPKSTLEEFGQRALQSIPSTLAFGGGIPGALSTTAGAGVATGAKQLGASPAVQDALHFGTEFGTRGLLNKIPTVAANKQAPIYGGLSDLAGREGAYVENALEKGAKGSKVAPALQDSFNNLAEGIRSGTNKDRQSLNQVDRILSNLINPDGSLDFAPALTARQQIGQLIKTATGKAKSVLTDLYKNINKHLKTDNLTNPEYAKTLSRKDRIIEIDNLQKAAKQGLDEWIQGLPKGQYSKWIGSPIGKTIGKLGDIFTRFAILAKNDPELGARHYWEVTKALTKNNLPEVIGAVNRINKLVEKEIPRAKEIKKGKVYRVLS